MHKLRAPKRHESQAVTELIVAYNLEDVGEPDLTEDDLVQEWALLDLEQNAWVAEEADMSLSGYATVRHKGDGVYDGFAVVHPKFAGHGLEESLLARIEERVIECARNASQAKWKLQFMINGANEEAKQRFLANGYQAVRAFLNMQIVMKHPPDEPQLAAGIELRPLNPEQDMEKLFGAHQEAFADHWGHTVGEFETFSKRVQSGMELPLCYIAWENGEVAGYVLNRYFSDFGLVNTLGVRRAWRKKGLGLALLLHSFQLFYERGYKKVELGVDAESLTGAVRLYERAGMEVNRTFVRYEK